MIISEYSMELSSTERIFPSLAYPIYGMLMEKVDKRHGDFLHEQSISPISQGLRIHPCRTKAQWRVNLFGEEGQDIFAEVLDHLQEIQLNRGDRLLEITEKRPVFKITARELIDRAGEIPHDAPTTICFYTPTSFKSGGQYSIFPSAELILKNLIMQWNRYFTDYPLADEDMVHLMKDRLRIMKYQLRSEYFVIKGNKVPGFTGEITIGGRLPDPLVRIWKLLLCFSQYSGIGIKTSLGMGGVYIKKEDRD